MATKKKKNKFIKVSQESQLGRAQLIWTLCVAAVFMLICFQQVSKAPQLKESWTGPTPPKIRNVRNHGISSSEALESHR